MQASPSLFINWVTFWCHFFFFFVFVFSRATPVAHGGFQARGPIGAAPACLGHSHSNLGSEPPVTYTTARSHARSLTHWARPGMEPATSWFLVGTGTPSGALWIWSFFKKWSVSFWRNNVIPDQGKNQCWCPVFSKWDRQTHKQTNNT